MNDPFGIAIGHLAAVRGLCSASGADCGAGGLCPNFSAYTYTDFAFDAEGHNFDAVTFEPANKEEQ